MGFCLAADKRQQPVAAGNQFITNINNTCQGSSHLDNTTSCSNDIAPDFVEKIALDPGWGHYEALRSGAVVCR